MTNVVVFDMGGVLYDFQGDQLIARTSRRSRRWRSEEVQEIWVPLVHRFETGACSEAEFASAVVSAYDLTLDTAAFLLEFRKAAVGFYEGALKLLRDLRRNQRLMSLSNTNPVQWPEVLSELADDDPFHAHFPSHLSGFHKPDRRAFEALAQTHHSDARFFFLDDRALNVAAAAEVGWQARRVRGVAAARRACIELGVL
jgi:glucose-1-phosphatase